MDPLTIAIIAAIVGVLATVGVNGLFKVATRLPGRLRRALKGSRFIILGPPQVGKSSFANYLENDDFADEVPVAPTVSPSEIKGFTVDKGGQLQLELAAGLDLPGELTPKAQVASLTRADRKPPDAILVILPLDDYDAMGWFRSFAGVLDSALSRFPALARRLRALVIVLNKRDLVNDNVVQEIEAEVRAIVGDCMASSLGPEAGERVAVVPCTLYRSAKGRLAANTVVLTLIQGLARKGTLAVQT